MVAHETLLKDFPLNDAIHLSNRVIMAPLTRCMADDQLVPTQAMADYYARRADVGLIISEATIIRPDGQGYPNTPGIFSQDQINGWKMVTNAVHAKGGKIFLQLWHTGRVAHPHFFEGDKVLAPSATKIEGSVPRMRELTYITATPATEAEIHQLVEDYAQAAANAMEAGFDGVEIHGANGYLLDQFLHYDSNQREDDFGGSPENMSRFPLAVLDAVTERIGAERVGLRVSPAAYFNMEADPRDKAVFDYLLDQLNQRSLAFLHVGIFDDAMMFDDFGGKPVDYLRANYQGTLIGVGGFTPQTGSEALNANRFDLLAIGRPLIANPDFIEKVAQNETLTEYNDDMLSTLV